VCQLTKWYLEGPRQPKVGDFDDTLFIDQQILWLDGLFFAYDKNQEPEFQLIFFLQKQSTILTKPNLLQRHELVRRPVLRFIYDSVRALAYFLAPLVIAQVIKIK